MTLSLGGNHSADSLEGVAHTMVADIAFSTWLAYARIRAYGAAVVTRRMRVPAHVRAAARVTDPRRPIRSTTSGVAITNAQYTTGPLMASRSTVPPDHPYNTLHWSTMGLYVMYTTDCWQEVRVRRNSM